MHENQLWSRSTVNPHLATINNELVNYIIKDPRILFLDPQTGITLREVKLEMGQGQTNQALYGHENELYVVVREGVENPKYQISVFDCANGKYKRSWPLLSRVYRLVVVYDEIGSIVMAAWNGKSLEIFV